MSPSIVAVLLGTFTLRFSTGLTGALLIYYLERLHTFGGPQVGAAVVGVMTATYFLAELVLSPFFGLLSDRFGAHRIMQVGPIFGAVAVVATVLTTDLVLLGGTRWLEGSAAAASIPSILGFLAMATSGDELLRGRAVTRFEAATLAGLGIGVVAAGPLFEVFGRTAFLLNAVVYLVSLAIYRYGVRDVDIVAAERTGAPDEGAPPARRRIDLGRYRRILGGSKVWLLAPTWIALNAIVGAWSTQSIFQLVAEPRLGFEDQVLMGGFGRVQVSIGLAGALVVFFAGLAYWGNRFKSLRRTSIIGIGIGGGLAMIAAVVGINHSGGWPGAVQVVLGVAAAAGLFVLAGATPAALGLLADISEGHPHDRGAIMGLYSVFLGVGQITGSLLSGGAAQIFGLDGLLGASTGLLVIALLPLGRLRASEHQLEVAEAAAEARLAAEPPLPMREPGS
ncbi:MAG: MFS transporter [Candidatus Limnocylindria bacterium]